MLASHVEITVPALRYTRDPDDPECGVVLGVEYLPLQSFQATA
jgi:hypothetical protein